MIIEGGSRCDAAFFGEHLSDTDSSNETAESVYSEGVALGTPKEMLASFEARAAGSTVKNFFTHMAFNNKGDWPLNPAEEIQAYKMAAKKQGLEGQPFFVVRHIKPNGDQHFHTITLRIGADGKAVNDDYRDQFRMAESSREIEKAFGLRRMENVIKRDPAAKQTKKWERYRGAATGYSVKRVARDLKDMRAKAGEKNGLDFVRSLESSRYVLARGDKSPFVIIDRAGTQEIPDVRKFRTLRPLIFKTKIPRQIDADIGGSRKCLFHLEKVKIGKANQFLVLTGDSC